MKKYIRRLFVILSLMRASTAGAVELGENLRYETTWTTHKLQGKLMADGTPYTTEGMTAACNDFPLGTLLMVNLGPRFLIVTVTDRMAEDNKLDLSRKAFSLLAPLARGRILTTVRVLRYTPDDFEQIESSTVKFRTGGIDPSMP